MEKEEMISDLPSEGLAKKLDFTTTAAKLSLPARPSPSHTQPKTCSKLEPLRQPEEPEGQVQVQRQPPLAFQAHAQPSTQLSLSNFPSGETISARSKTPPQVIATSPQTRQHHATMTRRVLQPSSDYQVSKNDSPPSQMQPRFESKDSKDDTPKKKKHCNCKHSRCLKLYCECFAAGTYCDGCNCLNCHNNEFNEAARQEAVAAVLERNPNAFRPKIAGSPHGSKGSQVEAREALIVKHNKGCHCKKSGCLKKYCECFQANIMCSDNCRCLDCKNFEGSEERKALFLGNNKSEVTHMQQAANAAISGAVGQSGYLNSLASRKRKSDEITCGRAPKSPTVHQITRYEKGQFLPNQAAASMTSTPVPCQNNRAESRSSKSYRSLLADVILPHDAKALCSLLVAVSTEVRDRLADERGIREGSTDEADKKTESNSPDCVLNGHVSRVQAATEPSNSGLDQLYQQNERPLTPRTRALLCDEEHTIISGNDSLTPGATDQDEAIDSVNRYDLSKTYAEQEKRVLTGLRDFLNQLITYGSIKEKASSASAEHERSSQEATRMSKRIP